MIWRLTPLLLFATSALAGEGWESRPHVCDQSTGPRLERCQEWIRTVQRPDIPASCCGDADAFIADDFEVDAEGNLYAIITADYPEPPGYLEEDGTLTKPSFVVRRGMKILIPEAKRNHDPRDANMSGHGVVFMMPSNGTVLCYFAPPLI